MEHVDRACELCGTIFTRLVGVRGRPRVFCSKQCRKKAGRLRAAARVINLDQCTPWDGEGLERWTGDDTA